MKKQTRKKKNPAPLAGNAEKKLAAIVALLKDEHGEWRDDVSGADFVMDVTNIVNDEAS